MRARCQIMVRVSLRWWLPLYILGVRLMSELTGLEPDPDKVRYWVKKGIKFKVVQQ